NLAHAFLFCGTRGTGKTSTAKILARAVNCEHPVDGNPCNECEICRGILDDSILDVVEMDGASRNKVENIRDLIDDVAFLPARAKKKVYIIDEVHMVTTQAFNALLKTLEEPPAHVLFILATTELNKIPPTVLSRCQRFDFKRITPDAIVNRLSEIVAASGRSVSREALYLVAELGDGSMRDSLSILEQALGYSDEALGYDDLLKIIGITDYDALYSICEAFAHGDGGAALTVLDELIENGKEPEVFMDRLCRFLRDVLVVKLTKTPEQMVNTSKEQIEKMQKLAEMFTREKLIFALKILNEAVVDAKLSGYGRTVYELALVKLCEPSYDASYEALLARVAELEKKLQNGVVQLAETSAAPVDIPPWDEPENLPPAPKKLPREEATAPAPEPVAKAKANAEDVPAAIARFDEVKEYIKAHGGAPVVPHINRATPMILREKFALVFAKEAMMNKTVVGRAGNLELIKIAISAVTGEDWEVLCLSEKEAGISSAEEDSLNKLIELSKTHQEIEIL
ncbi:MAG: DNA polymerase III subunit gamma/tau, partial [Clostridia bacterium]|nr:DNA polymerase III subunit gamma/tau [Clostridia bacterium]